MDSERLKEVQEVFAKALELPSGQRRQYVARRCADSPELHAEVAGHLERYQKLGSFLEESLPAQLPAFAQAQLALSAASLGLAPGDRLGAYEIVSLLAFGGTSLVFRARQLSLGERRVALKVVPAARLPDDARERFRREARIAAGIQHAGLVTIHDYGEDEKRQILYYAMQLLEGPSMASVLARFVKTGKPPADAERRLLVERFVEIGEGLGSLHAAGLVHRDVKPANIVLAAGGENEPLSQPAVLVDLGLVRPVSGEHPSSTLVATPSYASPEQLRGESVDARTDVYSLGVTMHVLLAGRSPSPEAESDETLAAESSPGIDPPLRAIVEKAIEPRKGWRYPDGAALSRDLRSWLSGQPVAAGSMPVPVRIYRWMVRHPRAALRLAWRTAAVVVLAGLLLLGAAEGYTVVAAARDAERSLKRGDLEGFVSAARDVPASLAWLLLEDDASRLARELGTGHPSGPMAECLLELEQGGVPAAVLHAARYLERDGLAAHPDLAAIVLHGLRTHSGPSRPEKITSLGVVARLFFERPDLSPEELRLSEPFRSLLLRFVLEHDDPSTSGFALTGLSGCGTPRQIPALLRWLEPLVEVGKRDSRELARLTLNCMTRIIRRSEGCGFTGQPHETDLGHVLRNAKRILAPLDERGQMGLSLERLFVAVASATRATGSGPSLDELLREFEPESRLARAAMLDPHVLAELRHWSRRMHGSYGMYKTYGMLVGMYDSTALASRLEQQVRIASSASRMLRRRCLSFYRAGLEWAHRQLVGLKRGEDLDSNTRLGAYLAELGSPVQIQDLVEDLSIGSKEAVKWNFEGPRVRAQGRKLELSTRCVTFEQDPLKEEDGYARLGVFGRSELRFRFHSAPKHDGALQLELYLQNGLRPLLPHNGQSSISILLDGVLVHERVPILGHSPRASLFSLSPATEERDHEIVVRLHETSNTTLRLYWARVFYW